jgi:hypothetical protein
MDDSPGLTALARSVRSLARAVWVLVVIMLLWVAYTGWARFQSARFAGRFPRDGPSRMTMTTSGITPVATPRSFSCELPAEDMVHRASAVLLTSYQPSGNSFKAVVAEIVKVEPGTTVEYKVGEEFPDPAIARRRPDGVSYGDGNVVFLDGSPALMRCAFSFENGRIGGLGDMTLDKLRGLAGKKKP